MTSFSIDDLKHTLPGAADLASMSGDELAEALQRVLGKAAEGAVIRVAGQDDQRGKFGEESGFAAGFQADVNPGLPVVVDGAAALIGGLLAVPWFPASDFQSWISKFRSSPDAFEF